MSANYTAQNLGIYIGYRLNKLKARISQLFQTVCHTFSGSETSEKDEINIHAEYLINTYGNSILRLAYSYLHNMNDAEDIVQDTLIQYIKTKPSFDSGPSEKAWLMQVAGNLSKNKIKYNTIRNTDELNDQLMSEEKDDLAFVWDAVKELPVKYREVIHLFYYEGYQTSQIADILSKNEQSVRTILHRGRKILKDILKEAYDFEQ